MLRLRPTPLDKVVELDLDNESLAIIDEKLRSGEFGSVQAVLSAALQTMMAQDEREQREASLSLRLQHRLRYSFWRLVLSFCNDLEEQGAIEAE